MDSREGMLLLLLASGLLDLDSLEWKSASSAGSGVVRPGNDIVTQLPPPEYTIRAMSLRKSSVWKSCEKRTFFTRVVGVIRLHRRLEKQSFSFTGISSCRCPRCEKLKGKRRNAIDEDEMKFQRVARDRR